MEKIITRDNLKNFAYVNNTIVTKPIKGVVLFFYGLNFRNPICCSLLQPLVLDEQPNRRLYR